MQWLGPNISSSLSITIIIYYLCRPQVMPMATTVAATSRRGIFMILSPAKTLDISELVFAPPIDEHANNNEEHHDVHAHKFEYVSQPSCDLPKTRQLAKILKSKSKKQLKDLLKVSDKISDTVKDYYDAFNVDLSEHQKKNGGNKKAAVFSFDGPAFKGISASTCDPNTIKYMQEHLRIIDPLYGALRPLDQIQPYRLEMATKSILKDLNTDDKSLASWWKASITSNILQDMKALECNVLMNLASDEYSSAIDATKVEEQECKFIKVAFQQEGKVVAVHAKKARGLMVRYISEKKLNSVEEIQNFDQDGYCFCKERSDEMTIVFDRSKNWKDVTALISNTDNKRKATKESVKKGVSKKIR
jgi:cytoplasmic iron level regulating protein YaaA (DUF328/UPF0246 family)